MSCTWFKKLLVTIWFKIYLNVFVGAWYVLKEQVWDRHRKLSDLHGRQATVVITGGTRGIGFEAVKKLLALDCKIIMGCRKPSETQKTFDKLRTEGLEGGSVEFLSLDLKSNASVKAFAQAVIDKKIPVHVLVNNAGIMFGKREETEDGFESQLATNYLGHFLLSHLLLPLLEQSGSSQQPSRIVNVSSSAHFLGSWMDFDDLNLSEIYSPELAYGNSKAAQVMFSKYLDSSLQSRNAPVRVVSLHPGIVLTGLYTNVTWVKWFNWVAWILMKTASQGGDTVVHAALSPEVTNTTEIGLYLENSRPARTSCFTSSLQKQARLWGLTCAMLDIEEFGKKQKNSQ